MLLFVELKQYLPGRARPNGILIWAVQGLGPDAREQTRHGLKVQDSQPNTQEDSSGELWDG